MMSAVAQHLFERSAALAIAAVKIFEGPGQKQTGTAGHAPSPHSDMRGRRRALHAQAAVFVPANFFSSATHLFAWHIRSIIFV
jgi:hypothetical protein